MKKLFALTMLSIFFATAAIGQSELPVQTTWMKEDSYGRMYDTKIPKERYRTNANGEIEGLYILYYEDGKTIKQKITYKNGKKDGPANLGYASGNYKNDLEEGEWIEHYKDDNITIFNYIQGVIVGKSITYSDKSRTKILSFTEYQNGTSNGKHVSYFEDGTIKEEGNYLNGEKTGFWIEYGPDLVTREYIFSKGNYINGNRDGIWTNYGKFYAYLGAYGKEYSYEPKKTENSYLEFSGGSDVAFAPKKGYNAKYNNGTYLNDYFGSASKEINNIDSNPPINTSNAQSDLEPQHSIASENPVVQNYFSDVVISTSTISFNEDDEARLEETLNTLVMQGKMTQSEKEETKQRVMQAWKDEEIKNQIASQEQAQKQVASQQDQVKQQAIEQPEIIMPEEAKEDEFTKLRNTPLTDWEEIMVGSWEFKSEKIYSKNNEVFILKIQISFMDDRTYVYNDYITKWLDSQIIDQQIHKGLWQLNWGTLSFLINEINGQPSKDNDQIFFEKLTAKKANFTFNIEDLGKIEFSGSKVSSSSAGFNSNSINTIKNGNSSFSQ